MADTCYTAIARDHLGLARLIEENPIVADWIYDNAMLCLKFCQNTNTEFDELEVESHMRLEGGIAQIVSVIRRKDVETLVNQVNSLDVVDESEVSEDTTVTPIGWDRNTGNLVCQLG